MIGVSDYDLWRQIDREIRQKLNVVFKDNGEFWMNEEDFVKYFRELFICHLGPGQYLESRPNTVKLSTWSTTAFPGEWVKGISAGGSALENRHQNPQYNILLEWPKNDSNRNRLCTVVIELVQRSKFGRLIRPKIAF